MIWVVSNSTNVCVLHFVVCYFVCYICSSTSVCVVLCCVFSFNSANVCGRCLKRPVVCWRTHCWWATCCQSSHDKARSGHRMTTLTGTWMVSTKCHHDNVAMTLTHILSFRWEEHDAILQWSPWWYGHDLDTHSVIWRQEHDDVLQLSPWQCGHDLHTNILSNFNRYDTECGHGIILCVCVWQIWYCMWPWSNSVYYLCDRYDTECGHGTILCVCVWQIWY